MESARVRDFHTSCWSIWNRTSEHSCNLFILYSSNLFMLYILRYSLQILLCEKAFRILRRPIRKAKRFFHVWEIHFASRIGRSKIRNAFSHSKMWYENLSMYEIMKDIMLLCRFVVSVNPAFIFFPFLLFFVLFCWPWNALHLICSWLEIYLSDNLCFTFRFFAFTGCWKMISFWFKQSCWYHVTCSLAIYHTSTLLWKQIQSIRLNT